MPSKNYKLTTVPIPLNGYVIYAMVAYEEGDVCLYARNATGDIIDSMFRYKSGKWDAWSKQVSQRVDRNMGWKL